VTLQLRLPQELIDLPEPWRSTNGFERDRALRNLQLTPESFEVGLDVLERTLRALAKLPQPGKLALPAGIDDAYPLVMHLLSKRIPALDDLANAPFEQYLLESLDEPPDEATANNLASVWVYSVSAEMSRSVLMWLTNRWRQVPKERRARMVDIAEQAWPNLPEDLAITLLTTTSTVAREDSLALLARVQAQAATPALREIASTYRAWVATRDDPATGDRS
jgi:hypothetical protein